MKSGVQSEKVEDYDGSHADVDKNKILSRRFTAWPNYEVISGFGSEPKKLVSS